MNEEVEVDGSASTGQFPSHPLVEHWTGRRWVVTPVQVQPDTVFGAGAVKSVYAVNPSNAWLVGTSGTAQNPLIEHWDGRRWRIVPHPAAALPTGIFYSVSGSSSQDVWAVGRYVTADGIERPLTEHWDGRVWTVVPAPDSGDRLAALVSVSARTPTDVWAVGSRRASASTPQAVSLVLHWDGRVWTAVAGPDRPGTDSSLSSVRVFGPRDVYTAGFGGLRRWDGFSWTAPPLVAEPSWGDSWRTVGGTGPDDVWAAGYAFTYSVLAGGGLNQSRIAHRCTRGPAAGARTPATPGPAG
jgi:hypothetical protein